MGLSRQARIITLLVIDTAFFFLELIVGYAVGSLALVADSFHMLNDVLSLLVALYTIKLATSPSSAANSYGWQRAEILGALINGVFLVALCMTIALEAIGRIVQPPEISNPKLIVIVGSLGLLSNIVGLFLFHEHGHGHGHSHGSEGAIALPEDEDEGVVGAGGGQRRERADSMSSLFQHPAQTRAQVIETAQEYGYGRPSIDENSGGAGPGAGFMGAMSPPSTHARGQSMSRRSKGMGHRGSGSKSGSRRSDGASGVVGTMTMPSIGADQVKSPVSPLSPPIVIPDTTASGENGQPGKANGHVEHAHTHKHKHKHMASDADDAERGHAQAGDAQAHGHGHDHSHAGHGHDHAGSAGGGGGGGDGHSHGAGGHGGHGHSHGSMNMRGVFLHVLGDALGNVGVIAAGLVIWFFEGRWTLYFDPGVSLVITCIIFSSALPLVKSASYILLQGVPSHVSLEAVRSGIKSVNGVVSVHELHIWQLSESTVVASVHVMITPGVEYMGVANGIRGVMHAHGIHSVTIQPEFYEDGASIEEETACLIRCPPEQCGTDTCCPPVAGSKNGALVNVDEGDEHDHAGHSH